MILCIISRLFLFGDTEIEIFGDKAEKIDLKLVNRLTKFDITLNRLIKNKVINK